MRDEEGVDLFIYGIIPGNECKIAPGNFLLHRKCSQCEIPMQKIPPEKFPHIS